MHALGSFAEHVIVDGNDLLLSYTCSFMKLLECKIMLLHSIGGPYRGIEKSDFFIQCVLWIPEILGSCIWFYKPIMAQLQIVTLKCCLWFEGLAVGVKAFDALMFMDFFSLTDYSWQVIIFPEERSISAE